MDFTAANYKMTQFVFPISASSPITMEICIRISVMGGIKYATGLSARIREPRNLGTAAKVISGQVGGAGKPVAGHRQTSAPPDTEALFFENAYPKGKRRRGYICPLIFSEEPGATHLPKNIPDGKRS